MDADMAGLPEDIVELPRLRPGHVVLVTGGTKGIGLGCAMVFAEAGANVVICGRDTAAGSEALRAISPRARAEIIFEPCDVAAPGAVEALVSSTVQRFGRLDTLVNNAARFTGWRRIDDISVDEMRQVLETNVVGYFAASKSALPHLRRYRGSIVNVGSLAGELGLHLDSAYTASKGAITALTRSLAIDEAEHGVRVNAVLPGNIFTESRQRTEAQAERGAEMHEYIESWQWMSRSGTIEEVGRVVLFLASPLASYMTGAAIPVGGGLELGVGPKQPYPDFGIR